MKTADATLDRLLRTLEELGAQEDGAMAGGDWPAFLALVQRAEPLVRRVLELASGPVPPAVALRARGLALVASRGERRQRLTRLLETTRDEINNLDEARARVRSLRPAYAAGIRRQPGLTGFTASA